MIVRWVVGVVLLFGILLLMLPDRDEQTLARIASASMLVCTAELREAVAEHLQQGEGAIPAFDNPCPDLLAELDVSEQGVITLRGLSHPLSMVLEPEFIGSEARWRCHGEPEEWITRLCTVDK